MQGRLLNRRKERAKRFLRLIGLLVLFSGLLVVFLTMFPLLFPGSYISPVPKKYTLLFNKNAWQNKQSPQELEVMLRHEHIAVSEVGTIEDGYVVKLETGEQIIFSPQKSFSKQISSLQLMLRRFTIDGKRIITLDLRFDNPVVTLK